MKTVLVTGACINTGVAIVEKFASEGYNVVFTGRKQEQVKEAETRYREKFPGVSIIGYAIDLMKKAFLSKRWFATPQIKGLVWRRLKIRLPIFNASSTPTSFGTGVLVSTRRRG